MTKIEYSKVIKESAKKLRCLEKQQHKTFVRDRIRFLWLLKSGRCASQIEAGELTLDYGPAAANAYGSSTKAEGSRFC